MESKWLLNLSPCPDARLRLICAHHAGGSAQYFESWVECLEPDCELIAVNLPGRGARRDESPMRNLDEVVEHLVDALLPYTDRPYAMFGDSIGAILSFEVIRELRKRSAALPLRLFASGMVAPHIIGGIRGHRYINSPTINSSTVWYVMQACWMKPHWPTKSCVKS